MDAESQAPDGRDPRYDVAVSFAGEDREYVEQVVQRLKDQGATVFYDRDAVANLWGRNLLDELVERYREQAFRTLMFVSGAYARKAWPNQERQAAQERAMRSLNEPYILPVRLDDTPLRGLHATTMWVDGRTLTPNQVADLAMEHLRQHGRDVAPPPAKREMAQRVNVRAIPERMASGEWEVPYTIHNGSSYPIHNAVLLIDDPGQEGRPEDQHGTAIEVVLGPLAAGEVSEGRIPYVRLTREPAFAELTYMAALLFTDHWGNHWAATGREVRRLRHAPRICKLKPSYRSSRASSDGVRYRPARSTAGTHVRVAVKAGPAAKLGSAEGIGDDRFGGC